MRLRYFGTLLIILLCSLVYGQNPVADSTKLAGFARFLYDQKLYDFAAEEYERLHYLFPNEAGYLTQLLKSYRKLNKYDEVEKKGASLDLKNPDILKEYVLSMALNDQPAIAQLVFDKHQDVLPDAASKKMTLDLAVLRQNWRQSDSLYKVWNVKDDGYYEIIHSGLNQKRKSPFLAGTLSALLPGAGRVYAKDVKDGIISFIFIAATSYQSYRRFSQGGIKSAGGWIYGGFAAGFYIGNIYGSIKSAKSYNKKQKSKLYEQSKRHIDLYYGF